MHLEEEQKTKRKRITSNYNSKYYSPYYLRRVLVEYPRVDKNKLVEAVAMYFKLAREDMALGDKINLQDKLGNLYLKKEKREVYIDENGDIINKLPINHRATWKLWKEKPELIKKSYVRYVNDHSNNHVFSLHYQVSKAVFRNKNIYNFKFNRTLKQTLSENIFDKKVEAYLNPYKNE